tara:strand:- start:86 stop:391 length:306 start_codon:yes stop_codon:yes gene_type:complete
MAFGDSLIDDIVRVTDEEIERVMNIFNERCQEIEGKSWQDKIDTLNKCNCCERHKINRPSTFTVWYELPFHNTQHIDCKCNCRHMARHICRTICGSVDDNE